MGFAAHKSTHFDVHNLLRYAAQCLPKIPFATFSGMQVQSFLVCKIILLRYAAHNLLTTQVCSSQPTQVCSSQPTHVFSSQPSQITALNLSMYAAHNLPRWAARKPLTCAAHNLLQYKTHSGWNSQQTFI
jgi:hypothetical protein